MSTATVSREDQIINTMIQQLGGNRFFAMTGTKPQYKDTKNGDVLLAFKLTRNASKATHLKLTYKGGLDLYEMEFVKCSVKEIKTVKKFEQLYGDQLQEIFTDATGLYTRL